ncbi:hypothetical protein BMWSH_3947 [Priestia megaterium WSH-002]|uniref:Uncharacterized protein n=1 Tax=Priestia megaterium (strain WSH-002) TaxID=1006007 RepID=A0A8D4BPY5_PRIMW|nr:hypothetical protein BMWSH_3947 [Priestia megaterium WSH-002]
MFQILKKYMFVRLFNPNEVVEKEYFLRNNKKEAIAYARSR